jgi:hypothetical protein
VNDRANERYLRTSINNIKRMLRLQGSDWRVDICRRAAKRRIEIARPGFTARPCGRRCCARLPPGNGLAFLGRKGRIETFEREFGLHASTLELGRRLYVEGQ